MLVEIEGVPEDLPTNGGKDAYPVVFDRFENGRMYYKWVGTGPIPIVLSDSNDGKKNSVE